MDVHGGFIVPKTKVWMIDVSIHEIKIVVFFIVNGDETPVKEYQKVCDFSD